MIAYRIADARHPIFDGTGAMLRGGRWNSIGQRVIYAAESYAGAMLEILVHANLAVPPKHHQVVRIAIPESVAIETLSPSSLPGWDAEDVTTARAFGDEWLRGKVEPQFSECQASSPKDVSTTSSLTRRTVPPD